MKLLSIRNLFFQLPDDFNGQMSDALQLLADYHKRKNGDIEIVPGDGGSYEQDFSAFWEARKDGYSIYGGWNVSELKGDRFVSCVDVTR